MVARRKNLLPINDQTQQRKAAPLLLGYARVSKADDQDTGPQIEALEAAGCQRVYEEHISGGRWDRRELHRLLDRLQPGDVLTVWKLDRLSRSLKDLLLILDKIDERAMVRERTQAVCDQRELRVATEDASRNSRPNRKRKF